MVDEIFPVEEIPAAKRRKKQAEIYAQIELPSPFFSWPGLLIPRDTQEKFLGLIADSSKKVVEATLENNTRNREEKHLWTREDRKRDYSKRIQRQNEQKSLQNRQVDKIH